LLTSQSADLLRVAEELAAALVLARAAATTLLDALLPWKIAVQLAWSGVSSVDGDILAGSYSRAGSGSHAFDDLLRWDGRVNGASKRKKAGRREKDGLELHLELSMRWIAREVVCCGGRIGRKRRFWWGWSATGEGKGGSYVSTKRARKERLGGANKRNLRAKENLTFE
jgi:hypothetical protein